MAIYRQVYMTFWTDPKVVNDFTPEDRYFYLYLITNNHTNLCGCYEVSIKQMAWETGYNEDTVSRLLTRLMQLNVIRYCEKTKEVLLLNWHKYNWNKSPKLVKAIRGDSEGIKDGGFKEYVLSALEGYPIDTLSTTDAYPMHTSVPVPVPDAVTVAVPDPDEIRAYVKEKGYKIDPQRFYDFYRQKGFPTDWKAQVDYWEQTEFKKTPKKHTGYIQRSAPEEGSFGTEYFSGGMQ